MSRLVNIKITGGTATGPFNIYYNTISTSNYATSNVTYLPATGVTYEELTIGIGYPVIVPTSSTSVIVQSTISSVSTSYPLGTPLPTATPIPTTTLTATPTPTIMPTPSPTITSNKIYGLRLFDLGGNPSYYTYTNLQNDFCLCLGDKKFESTGEITGTTGLFGPIDGYQIFCKGTCVDLPSLTPTPSRSPSPTPTPSRSPSPTPTFSPTPTPTATPAPTSTPTPTPSSTPEPTPTPTQSPWSGYWGTTIVEACNAYSTSDTQRLSTFYSTNTSSLCGGSPNTIYDWTSSTLTQDLTTNGTFYICNAGGVREFLVSGAPSNKDAVSQGACFPCPTPTPTSTPTPTPTFSPTPSPTPTPSTAVFSGAQYAQSSGGAACAANNSITLILNGTFCSFEFGSSSGLQNVFLNDQTLYLAYSGQYRQIRITNSSTGSFVSIGSCVTCPTSTPTPTPSRTPSPTPTPSRSPSPTPSPTQVVQQLKYSITSAGDACSNYQSGLNTDSTTIVYGKSNFCDLATGNNLDTISSTTILNYSNNSQQFYVSDGTNSRWFQKNGAGSLAFAIGACTACPTPTPTPTPSPTFSATPAPTATPLPTFTPTAVGAGYYDDGYGCVYFANGDPGAGYNACTQWTTLKLYGSGGGATDATTTILSPGQCYCFISTKYEALATVWSFGVPSGLNDVSGGTPNSCGSPCP